MKFSIPAFTLIECMIVTALVAVLTMITASSFSFMRAWLVRADIDTLATVCRYAQQSALMLGQQQEIILDPVQRCYHFNDHTYYLSPGVFFGTVPHVKGPPASPGTTLSKPITFVNNRILCYEHGVISSGAVYLTDTSRSVLYALSNAVSHSSFLRKYTYHGTWLPLT